MAELPRPGVRAADLTGGWEAENRRRRGEQTEPGHWSLYSRISAAVAEALQVAAEEMVEEEEGHLLPQRPGFEVNPP